jgi:hypothetical protein
MKRIVVLSVAVILGAGPVAAQLGLLGGILGGIGGGIPVHDTPNGVILAGQSATLGTQAGYQRNMVGSLGTLEQLARQIVIDKIPWTTHLPPTPHSTNPHDVLGEMATWGTSMATGRLSQTSWGAASTRIANLPALVAIIRAQMQPPNVPASGTPPITRTPPILGRSSPLLAQLATVEAIDAAGINNLETIGQARAHLVTDMPAMQALGSQILSLRREDNGPTQQMQYIAASQAQQTSTAVHNLQVNTGILETVTVIAKGIGDANTADLNMQAAQEQTRLQQATGIAHMADTFRNHP